MVLRNHKFSTLATIYFVLDLIILISYLFLPWVSLYVLKSSAFLLPFRLFSWAGELGQISELDFITGGAVSAVRTPMTIVAVICFLFYLLPIFVIAALVFALVKVDEERFMLFSRLSFITGLVIAIIFFFIKLFVTNRIEAAVSGANLSNFISGDSIGSLVSLQFGYYLILLCSLIGIVVPFVMREKRPNYLSDFSKVSSLVKKGINTVKRKQAPIEERREDVFLQREEPEEIPIIELKSADEDLKIYSLPSTLGRDELEADVTLSDETVSRKHCQFLLYNHSMILLQDLGSTHGTVLAGETLIPNKFYQVNDGDLIQLGNQTLMVSINDPNTPPKAADRTVGLKENSIPEALDRQRVDFSVSEVIDEPERTAILGSTPGVPFGRTKKIDYNGGETDFPTMALRGARQYFIINKTPFIVGSDENRVDYPLKAVGISKQHFKIHRNSDKFFITDLNSTNGVRLNGAYIKPGEPSLLKIGDSIILGELEFKFEDA